MPRHFEHAVASFDPTDRGVLLWTRLSGGAETVDWVVARDPRLRDVVASGSARTSPECDHTVVVDAGGLEPGTTYCYRFTTPEERSPVGRTRTLPETPTDRFRLGLVCCADYSVAPLGVYRALAEREVDLVLHLGDYIYEDEGGTRPRDHRPPHTAATLDDYRQRLAQIREDPDLQALHVRHPMTTIWDDHDLADNAWRDGAKKHDPERHGPWHERVRAAAQARQEWLPARLRDPDHPLVVYRSIQVGDLASLILLDTRFIGRDRHAGDAGAEELHDPARSLLGGEQREWLQAQLSDLGRPWAIVASGVVVNHLRLRMPLGKRINRLLPNGYAVLDGDVMHDDQWDGYPAERERLARALGERGRAGGRAVLLSGDVHSSWTFEGPREPANDEPGSGPPAAVEFTTPAVSSAAMGRAHYPGAWRALDRAASRMKHVPWAEVTQRGYVVLDVTPEAVQAEWWFVEPYDEDPAATAEFAAAFVTAREDWPPRLRRVSVATTDPVRDDLPDALPQRPGDLPALRRRRRARLAAEAIAAAALLALPPLAVAGMRRVTRR